MALHYAEFDERLKRITTSRAAVARRGAVRVVTDDGLIVAQPRSMRPQFPLRSLLVLAVVGFTFKGVLLAALGGTTYEARLGELQAGTTMERIGAWIMQPDPATLLVAQGLRPYLG